MRTAISVLVVSLMSACGGMPTETTQEDGAAVIIDAQSVETGSAAIIIEHDAGPESSSDGSVPDAVAADSATGQATDSSSPYAITDPSAGITYIPPCNPGLTQRSDGADKYCYEAFSPPQGQEYIRASARCSIGQMDVSRYSADGYMLTLHTKCQAAVSYKVSPTKYVCWSATESLHPCIWHVD